MPETKLNLRRIREHLRKRWPIYIAGALLLCFLNNLVYTVTRPRTPEKMRLRVLTVNVNAPQEAFDALADALLSAARAAEPELAEVVFEPVSYLGPGDSASSILLKVKLTAGDVDLILADAAGFEAAAAMGGCARLMQEDFPGAQFAYAVDADTGERYACGLEMRAEAILPGARGDVRLSAFTGAGNLDAALAALATLTERTTE